MRLWLRCFVNRSIEAAPAAVFATLLEEDVVRGIRNGKDEETVFPTDPPVTKSGNGKLPMRDFKAWLAKR